MILTEPLRAHRDRRGLRRRRHHRRRRPHRPGRRPAPRHRPGARRARPRAARRAQEGRLPHPRRPREGVEEVRPQEGPQGSAVLEALSGAPRRRDAAVRHRRRAGCRQPRAHPRARRSPSGRAAAAGARRRPLRGRARHPPLGPAARGGAGRRPGRRGRRRRAASAWCRRPAVAWLAADERVPAAMISASHNPFADNGIKLFAPGGRKLADDDRGAARGRARPLLAEARRPAPGRRRRRRSRRRDAGAVERYVGAPRRRRSRAARLDGLRVVVDCANGAASRVGAAGARARSAPTVDGASTPSPTARTSTPAAGRPTPRTCSAAVVAHGADVGLAFDGDADRVLAVDADGRARRRRPDHRHLRHRPATTGACCADDTVVVTVMTNLGLPPGMARARHRGASRPPVGDRYVLEALERRRLRRSAASSRGHVIFRDLATTGDGLLTGVQLLDVVRRAGPPARRAGRRRHDPAAAGAAQRARSPRPRPDVARRCRRRGRARSRPSSATTAGCWSGRAAPSRWCG